MLLFFNANIVNKGIIQITSCSIDENTKRHIMPANLAHFSAYFDQMAHMDDFIFSII